MRHIYWVIFLNENRINNKSKLLKKDFLIGFIFKDVGRYM